MRFTLKALFAASVSLAATAAIAETCTIRTSFSAGDFSPRYLTSESLPVIEERTEGRITLAMTPNRSVVPARETPGGGDEGPADPGQFAFTG